MSLLYSIKNLLIERVKRKTFNFFGHAELTFYGESSYNNVTFAIKTSQYMLN